MAVANTYTACSLAVTCVTRCKLQGFDESATPRFGQSAKMAATPVKQKKARSQRPVKEPLEKLREDGANGNSAFARALGSVDYMTREKGVQALTRWLQRKGDVAEGDMLKLWKGLYFCFWHSDKTPVQVNIRMLCKCDGHCRRPPPLTADRGDRFRFLYRLNWRKDLQVSCTC